MTFWVHEYELERNEIYSKAHYEISSPDQPVQCIYILINGKELFRIALITKHLCINLHVTELWEPNWGE